MSKLSNAFTYDANSACCGIVIDMELWNRLVIYL